MAEGITVKKSDDTAEWYEQVCLKSELADFGPVKGTIIMRPRGFYIWEQIQQYFNREIVDKFGVENAYFPLVIPESFFKKEAEHAEGFAPELAWIATENDADIKKEKAIVRPTSETIIVDSFSKWLRNYKQLPIKVNQWANVMRWEVKQTKLFLRGREFLWQEGHCIYQTDEECQKDVLGILHAYERMCKDVLALPVIIGEKTEAERFPGATHTYTMETLMPDGKAVQMGTSHNLGQGFMKAFDVKFRGDDEKDHYPFYNSWGVSTRLIGATIMMHSDDDGLILPPALVRHKVVIVPAFNKKNQDEILSAAQDVAKSLKSVGAIVDDRDYSMGWKLGDWEMKGAPIMLILGGRELENKQITLKARDASEKVSVSLDEIQTVIADELSAFHARLYEKAEKTISEKIKVATSKEEFKQLAEQGFMVKVPFCGNKDCEAQVEAEFGVGSRCIAFEDCVDQTCVFTGKPAIGYTYFSRSY